MTGLNWEPYELTTDARLDVRILVRRLLPVPARLQRAVLLVPGANSSADTFGIPNGGLVRHLAERGCDVWMLDWRASPLVLKRILKLRRSTEEIEAERAAFTLDRMVGQDVRAALQLVRTHIANADLALHGHCVGGGGVALAMARGLLEEFNVDRVVLSTLGLFYEVPWNTWIKAEDFLLEGILLPSEDPCCRAIDPHGSDEQWPPIFRRAYRRWPKSWLPLDTPSDRLLRQLSFMVGQPYSHDRIDPTIDGPPVESIFGPLHLGLYTHLGQMVRRGYAAPFNVRDQIDRERLRRGEPARPAPVGYFARQRFEPHQITLVAAGDNGVWHRDSIDLMFEWLRRSPTMRCEKHVIAGCNIQELYWGRDAPRLIYPMFSSALGVG